MKFKSRGKLEFMKMQQRNGYAPTSIRTNFNYEVYDFVEEWAEIMEKELTRSGTLTRESMLGLSFKTRKKVSDTQFYKAKDILEKVWKYGEYIKLVKE